MKIKTAVAIFILLLPSFFLTCCGQAGRNDNAVIVFKHGKIAGDPEPLRRLIAQFEKENPSVKVRDETHLRKRKCTLHAKLALCLEFIKRDEQFHPLVSSVV